MRRDVGWWIETAEQDLQMAQTLLKDEFFNGAAFHCQQASEKILKAVVLDIGEWERTHSGLELLSLLKRKGLEVPDSLFEDARLLDRSFIDSRYPNGVGGPPSKLYDRRTAEELIRCCERVMEWARSRLS